MMILMGAIGSGTMIIPGVSGSLIIMACGYYNTIMEVLHNFLHAFAHFDFDGFGVTAFTILAFMVGVIIGVIFVSKAIKALLKRVPQTVYHAILGLLVGSPFAIYYLTTNKYEINYSSPWVYIVSALSLALGVIFGIVLMKIEAKHNQELDKETEEASNDPA